MSSSIPSWQISTAHAQPFRGATDLAFCLKVPLDSLLVWASSKGSGETARMRRLAWTFAARIGDKYQIRLTRSIWQWMVLSSCMCVSFHTGSFAKLYQHHKIIKYLINMFYRCAFIKLFLWETQYRERIKFRFSLIASFLTTTIIFYYLLNLGTCNQCKSLFVCEWVCVEIPRNFAILLRL